MQKATLDTGQALPLQGSRGSDHSNVDASRSDRRVEPDSGKTFTFEEFKVAFAGHYSGHEILDYWHDACIPVSTLASEPPGTEPATLLAASAPDPAPVSGESLDEGHRSELVAPCPD
mmetsp:Transcript_147931/g.359073  ORF Transcript_147931/g.359073 Transcript_147931/m.359073 type:complete len:117 (-) Transcript_147931:32-382(-)